jgi:tetratricopeptide (TPR) repeat protein
MSTPPDASPAPAGVPSSEEVIEDLRREAALEDPEEHLEGLEALFLAALEARRKADFDQATKLLRKVLRREPRLAEPRLELAGLLMEAGQLDEATEQAREATRILDAGGQWTLDVPSHVMRSLAWDTLGEAIRRTADQDSVVFGDPEVWRGLMDEAKAAFRTAAELDPDNAHASYAAFGFGPAEEAPDNEEELDLVDLVGKDSADLVGKDSADLVGKDSDELSGET